MGEEGKRRASPGALIFSNLLLPRDRTGETQEVQKSVHLPQPHDLAVWLLLGPSRTSEHEDILASGRMVWASYTGARRPGRWCAARAGARDLFNLGSSGRGLHRRRGWGQITGGTRDVRARLTGGFNALAIEPASGFDGLRRAGERSETRVDESANQWGNSGGEGSKARSAEDEHDGGRRQRGRELHSSSAAKASPETASRRAPVAVTALSEAESPMTPMVSDAESCAQSSTPETWPQVKPSWGPRRSRPTCVNTKIFSLIRLLSTRPARRRSPPGSYPFRRVSSGVV